VKSSGESKTTRPKSRDISRFNNLFEDCSKLTHISNCLDDPGAVVDVRYIPSHFSCYTYVHNNCRMTAYEQEKNFPSREYHRRFFQGAFLTLPMVLGQKKDC
jgi:hypothetical protein